MPSLRERQQALADAIAGRGAATFPDERIAVYRRTFLANYRNALGATYPVIRRLVGTPFFNAAVDRYTIDYPSRSGDLNVYGDRFGAFLAAYAPAAPLPYLSSVAELEWAIDESHRAIDAPRVPEAVLAAFAAVAPSRLPVLRTGLDASCRLIRSAYPVLRIWETNQGGYAGDAHVDLDAGADQLLIRRDPDGVSIERVTMADFAWLSALHANRTLGEAIEIAQQADPTFDLGAALRAHIASGTIAAVIDA